MIPLCSGEMPRMWSEWGSKGLGFARRKECGSTATLPHTTKKKNRWKVEPFIEFPEKKQHARWEPALRISTRTEVDKIKSMFLRKRN